MSTNSTSTRCGRGFRSRSSEGGVSIVAVVDSASATRQVELTKRTFKTTTQRKRNPRLDTSDPAQRKYNLDLASCSQMEWPHWRPDLQCGDRHTPCAKQCCVSEVQKTNDCKVLHLPHLIIARRTVRSSQISHLWNLRRKLLESPLRPMLRYTQMAASSSQVMAVL